MPRTATLAAAAAAGLLPLLGGAAVMAAPSHPAASAARPGAATPRFSAAIKLDHAGGGEPSIVSDGHGNVYVTGPQRIPAIASAGTPGVGVWASHDDGRHFAFTGTFGSYAGGGDSDVQVAPDGTVYIADLEAVGSALCYSRDGAGSFSSIGPAPDPKGCGGVVVGQAGPSSDRQWLTADHTGDTSHLYLSYHELSSAQPVIFRSDNGGRDLFTAGPCGPMVTDPAIEQNIPQDVSGGTFMVKPVTDRDGTLYAMFTTTTQQQNVQNLPGHISGTFSNIYLAISHDQCATWTDVTVFDGSKVGANNVQFGDDFNDMAIDGAGNLYAIAAGYVNAPTANAPIARLYALTSHDHGLTWTAPKEISTEPGAYMLPGAIGGPGRGQVAVGVFHTVNGVTDPNDASGQWTFQVIETTDGFGQLGAAPHAAAVSLGHTLSTPVNRDSHGRPAIFHAADICNSGTLCGTPIPGVGKDRTLADFTSAAITTDGCPIFAFAANPGASTVANTFNYVSRQTTGCFHAGRTVAVATISASAPGPSRATAAGVAGVAARAVQDVTSPGGSDSGRAVAVGTARVSARGTVGGAAGASALAILGLLSALPLLRRRLRSRS